MNTWRRMSEINLVMVVRLDILDCRWWSLLKAVEAKISTGVPSSSLTETYQVFLSLSVVRYRTASSSSGSSGSAGSEC